MKKIIYFLLLAMAVNFSSCVVRTRQPRAAWVPGHYEIGPYGGRHWIRGHYRQF